MITANISEIFVSIQGEGLYAGQKQIFVRFAGCDLACDYCDEAAAHGGGRLMPLEEVKKKIKNIFSREQARTVSFTGGEPLLQAPALKELARYARRLGMKTYLETNGTRWRELAKVSGAFDVVAADIKLPGSSGRAFWNEHAQFLAVAPEKTFVKIVVTSKTSRSEFLKAVTISSFAGAGMPFFIQPVTPKKAIRPPSRAKLEIFYRLAVSRLEDVRILPQLHPLWGIK
jgi:organic radical activating enzyme